MSQWLVDVDVDDWAIPTLGLGDSVVPVDVPSARKNSHILATYGLE